MNRTILFNSETSIRIRSRENQNFRRTSEDRYYIICHVFCSSSVAQVSETSLRIQIGCLEIIRIARRSNFGPGQWPSIKGVWVVRKHESTRGKGQPMLKYLRIKGLLMLNRGGDPYSKLAFGALRSGAIWPLPPIKGNLAVRETRICARKGSASNRTTERN